VNIFRGRSINSTEKIAIGVSFIFILTVLKAEWWSRWRKMAFKHSPLLHSLRILKRWRYRCVGTTRYRVLDLCDRQLADDQLGCDRPKKEFHFQYRSMAKVIIIFFTLLWGRTMKAPPPADSTMIARNLGLTAQNVESQLLLDTLILS
jgi:hypothetical protein